MKISNSLLGSKNSNLKDNASQFNSSNFHNSPANNQKISISINGTESKLNHPPQTRNPSSVILQIPQDSQGTNEKLIKQMIKGDIKNVNKSLKFAGGYKKIQLQRLDNSLKKSLYRPEFQQQNRRNEDAFQQLGVDKTQPKYRPIDQNYNAQQNDNFTIQNLQSKIQLLKKDRQQRNNHILRPADHYTIADSKQKYQNVSHVQSSLDNISIENIQAKLQAHRRKMKAVQDSYNQSKGKKTPIDRYQYIKFNIDVDKEYKQLQVDNKQIYELVRKRQNLEPQEVQFQELWEAKKRNDPKLAEYDAKYQQYLLSKDAKNLLSGVARQNLYSWDKYTQPQHQKKNKIINAKSRDHYSRSPQKLNNRSPSAQKQHIQQKFGSDGLQSINDISEVIAKKDDKFISAYIFTQIDKSKTGMISKEQLHQYILSQQHIINGYNIDTKWLFTDLDNFETNRKGMLSKQQLAIFLATLQKLEHPKLALIKAQNYQKGSLIGTSGVEKKAIQSTFNKNKHLFERIFQQLDFNDDKLIKREQFIENIYIDSSCIKILDSQAIQIKAINKSITYRQIIGFILDDYLKQKNEKLRKSKEYITFNRFCEYFDVPQSLDLSKIDHKQRKKKQQKSLQLQIFDIDQEILILLKDIFNSIPRIYQDYIISNDFVEHSLRDPQILTLSDELCRIQSVETKLPVETVLTTLHRMQKQCDQYSTWNDIKSYFSRRGRPIDWDFDIINKKKQLRKQRLIKQRNRLNTNKLMETQQYFEYSEKLQNKSRDKIKLTTDKYTVPQPFDITDMKPKPDMGKFLAGERQFQELKTNFKANPVNKQILQSKPELIIGQVKKRKSEKQIKYNYDNYQNDRIQRALKRAQEEYQINQKIKTIKQMTEIKAGEIGIDLTKNLVDITKENEKKRKEKSKYKATKPQASQSLYPKDPSKIVQDRINKVQDKIKKGEEITNAKKKLIEDIKNKTKQINKQKRKIAQQIKTREAKQQSERDKILLGNLDFKPKINKKQISKEQKQLIEKQREERKKKQRQAQQMKLKLIQEQKKRKLAFEKKQTKLNIQGLTEEQIIDKIDEVDFQDLLLDEESKTQYLLEFDSSNKTKKQVKQRQAGLAGREKATMLEQQKYMTNLKRKHKEEVQKKNVNQDLSIESTKGQKTPVYRNQLNFHKSNALRRYRAIMQGKKPDSQFDRYTKYNKDEMEDQKNILLQHQEQLDDSQNEQQGTDSQQQNQQP